MKLEYATTSPATSKTTASTIMATAPTATISVATDAPTPAKRGVVKKLEYFVSSPSKDSVGPPLADVDGRVHAGAVVVTAAAAGATLQVSETVLPAGATINASPDGGCDSIINGVRMGVGGSYTSSGISSGGGNNNSNGDSNGSNISGVNPANAVTSKGQEEHPTKDDRKHHQKQRQQEDYKKEDEEEVHDMEEGKKKKVSFVPKNGGVGSSSAISISNPAAAAATIAAAGGRPARFPLDPTSVHPAFAGRRPLLPHESPASGRSYGLWNPEDVHPVYFGHLRHDAEASGAAGLPGWTGAGDGGALDRALRVLRGTAGSGVAPVSSSPRAGKGRVGKGDGGDSGKRGGGGSVAGVVRWTAEERAMVIGLLCEEASMTGVALENLEVSSTVA